MEITFSDFLVGNAVKMFVTSIEAIHRDGGLLKIHSCMFSAFLFT